MLEDNQSFFQTVLAAGAILSGFCGTFLSFRIGRESNYYRQPALSFEQEGAVDIFIDLTHFTSAFFLLILASLCAVVFGFLLPLLAIAGWSWALARPELTVGGLVAAVVLLMGYFLDELVHYKILRFDRLIHDAKEWGDEKFIVTGAIITAFGGAYVVWDAFGH